LYSNETNIEVRRKKMKKMCVVLAVLSLFASVALGQTTASNDIAIASEQTTGQSVGGSVFSDSPVTATGEGGQGGSAGSYSGLDFHPTTISKYPEYKPGLPNVNPVGTAWWMPSGDQTAFFNALAADLRFYVRTWTREEVEGILKAYGLPTGKYAKFGKKKGFEWGVALRKYQNLPVDQVEVKLGQIRVVGLDGQVAMIGETPEQINEKFSFLGDIPVTASKGKLQILTFVLGLKLAMDNGVNMVVINQKMNTVYLGKNISPNGGVGGATTNVSLAAIFGLSSTDAKAKAEPIVEFGAFEKNGHAKLPVLTPVKGVNEKGGKKSGDKGIEKKVNPEVLKPGAEDDGNKWQWGVPTSPQAKERAGYSIDEILHMSPSF
jgi:hypothetical protein